LPKRYGQTGTWTDVWGLALTLVEVLCGHAPIDGDHAAMMGSAIDPERRPTPRNEGVAVADDVEKIFAGALAVDPRDRLQDVAAFWNPLCRAVGLPEVVGETSTSLPPPAAPPPSANRVDSRARTALKGDVVAGGAGAGAVPDLLVSPRSPARPPAVAGAAGAVGLPPAASEKRPAPGSRARPPPAASRNAPDAALLGKTFDSFDDDAPGPRIQTDDGFGGGLGAVPSRTRLAPPSAAMVRPQTLAAGRSLNLSGALNLLGIAVLLMAGDFLYAMFTGETLQVGPARMLWVAGPLAALGLVKLLSALLSAGD
jgi:serine/threonine-protein kinase